MKITQGNFIKLLLRNRESMFECIKPTIENPNVALDDGKGVVFIKEFDDYAKNITPAVCLASNPNIDKNDPKEIKEVIRYHIQTANSQYSEEDGHFQGNSFEQKDIQFLRKAIKSIKSESQRTKTFAKSKPNNFEREV